MINVKLNISKLYQSRHFDSIISKVSLIINGLLIKYNTTQKKTMSVLAKSGEGRLKPDGENGKNGGSK